MGTGADRQLKVFEDTNSMKAVVDYIVSESKIGL
jgi:glutamate---cysteine ligase / carboxylate-amine ligase